jgi:hypothetical protein
LRYEDGYLTLSPGAVLPSLPLLQTWQRHVVTDAGP